MDDQAPLEVKDRDHPHGHEEEYSIGSAVMKIFVHEFITGGGLVNGKLPRSLLAEGLLMLRAVLEDFLALERYQIITTLDHRLTSRLRSLPPCRVEAIREGEYQQEFTSLVEEAEAVLIIAPETDLILADLTAVVEAKGKLLLGSSREAVVAMGNKATAYRRLSERGLPVPETHEVRFADDPSPIARRLGYPVVAKPIDGVGCQGGFMVRKEEGTHASVSLLSNGQEALPLTLNAQEIHGSKRLCYRGGRVPLTHRLTARAFENARAVLSAAPGLRGYFGVDLVLTEEEAWVVEVNPRLTTSYVGLRDVVRMNLAEAILKAISQGTLPRTVDIAGQACFSTLPK